MTALLNAGADVNAVNDDGKNIVCFATKNVIKDGFYQNTTDRWNRLSAAGLLLQHGANVNALMPDGRSPLYVTVSALADARRWGPQYRKCVYELLRLLVTYGADLHDSSRQLRANVYRRPLNTLTLTTPAGDYYFIVELFRAGAGLALLAHCYNVVASIHPGAKSISLCQAAVLAGYVPSDEELHQLQLEAAGNHLIQQLVNWLNEDRQQVPSLLRQCRVVIRRQLSAAARFRSILPAIDKLPVPNIVKLYLQFDGPLSEVDLNVFMPNQP